MPSDYNDNCNQCYSCQNESESHSVMSNSLRPQFDSWVRKIRWRRDRLSIPVFLGFPCGSARKESTYSAGAQGLIPGLGRSPGERKGYSLQYSGLENPWGRKESDMTE